MKYPIVRNENLICLAFKQSIST